MWGNLSEQMIGTNYNLHFDFSLDILKQAYFRNDTFLFIIFHP